MNGINDNIRLMALDFGSKTVGVAVSDALGMTAQGLGIIYRDRPKKLRSTYARLAGIIEEYSIKKIILGLPLLEDGSEGERCIRTREFAKGLIDRFGLPVVFEDERFTTIEAHSIMDERRIPREERYKYTDEIAAVLILEQYMNSRYGKDYFY